MAEVVFGKKALSDIDGIARFISRDSETNATLFVQHLLSEIDLLQNFHKMGRMVPEINAKNIREIIVGAYRIIYFIKSPNTLFIIAVHHTAMRLRKNVIKKEARRKK